MPDDLAGRGTYRDEGCCVKVIPRAAFSRDLGRGVADTEEKKAARLVNRRGVPDGAAAKAPAFGVFFCRLLLFCNIAREFFAIGGLFHIVPFPTGFCGVELPDRLSGSGVKSGHETGPAIIAWNADNGANERAFFISVLFIKVQTKADA